MIKNRTLKGLEISENVSTTVEDCNSQSYLNANPYLVSCPFNKIRSGSMLLKSFYCYNNVHVSHVSKI